MKQSYYYLHFTDEKPGAENLSNFPHSVWLVGRGAVDTPRLIRVSILTRWPPSTLIVSWKCAFYITTIVEDNEILKLNKIRSWN